jgi:hypothetical protein
MLPENSFEMKLMWAMGEIATSNLKVFEDLY